MNKKTIILPLLLMSGVILSSCYRMNFEHDYNSESVKYVYDKGISNLSNAVGSITTESIVSDSREFYGDNYSDLKQYMCLSGTIEKIINQNNILTSKTALSQVSQIGDNPQYEIAAEEKQTLWFEENEDSVDPDNPTFDLYEKTEVNEFDYVTEKYSIEQTDVCDKENFDSYFLGFSHKYICVDFPKTDQDSFVYKRYGYTSIVASLFTTQTVDYDGIPVVIKNLLEYEFEYNKTLGWVLLFVENVSTTSTMLNYEKEVTKEPILFAEQCSLTRFLYDRDLQQDIDKPKYESSEIDSNLYSRIISEEGYENTGVDVTTQFKKDNPDEKIDDVIIKYSMDLEAGKSYTFSTNGALEDDKYFGWSLIKDQVSSLSDYVIEGTSETLDDTFEVVQSCEIIAYLHIDKTTYDINSIDFNIIF